jgi:hypothetical protein
MGGEAVPAADEPMKSLKKLCEAAVGQGLLQKRKLPVSSTQPGGKTKVKKVDVYDLTSEGQEFLTRAVSREVLATAEGAGFLQSLQRGIEADRQKLHEEVVLALGGKTKGKDDGKLQKELDGLVKEVEKIARRLEKLEALARPAEDGGILGRIDQGFAALSARLEQALRSMPVPAAQSAAQAPSGMSPLPQPQRSTSQQEVKPGPVAARDLESSLKRVYEELRLLVRYQDGLVELPELYDEVQKVLPGLTIVDYHRELLKLEQQRKVELHILNEVRLAQEPEKAINRNDAVYYYLLWKKP